MVVRQPPGRVTLAGKTAGVGVAWQSVAALFAVVVGIGLFLLPRPLPPPPTPDPVPSTGSFPHLLVEELDVSTTDSSGRMHRRLLASELRRASPGAKSVLVDPRLTVFPAAGPSWHFTAESGEVSPDGKNIYLPGSVQARRGATRPLEIDGRDVRIMATNNYGESDKPATVRGAAFEARGTGLKIWFKDGRIELLDDTRGILQPR